MADDLAAANVNRSYQLAASSIAIFTFLLFFLYPRFVSGDVDPLLGAVSVDVRIDDARHAGVFETAGEIDRGHPTGFQPSFDRHLATARVDADGDPTGEAPACIHDDLGLLERRDGAKRGVRPGKHRGGELRVGSGLGSRVVVEIPIRSMPRSAEAETERAARAGARP